MNNKFYKTRIKKFEIPTKEVFYDFCRKHLWIGNDDKKIDALYFQIYHIQKWKKKNGQFPKTWQSLVASSNSLLFGQKPSGDKQ